MAKSKKKSGPVKIRDVAKPKKKATVKPSRKTNPYHFIGSKTGLKKTAETLISNACSQIVKVLDKPLVKGEPDYARLRREWLKRRMTSWGKAALSRF